MEYIKTNYNEIQENIKQCVEKTNNNFNDITFVAVTKNVDIKKMEYAKKLGISNFGENRVQEFLKKYEYFGDSVTWHLIGHLQKNKVKYIIDKVDLIHSVDSKELADEINKRAKKINKVQKILIQVNIAEDINKYGVSENEIPHLLNYVANLNNVELCGFMTIIPYSENIEEHKKFFSKMYETSIDNTHTLVHNVDKIFLSMGMTNDYQDALMFNSNMVRIGTGLFGE